MLLQRSSIDGDCETASDQDDGNADLGLGDDEGIRKKLEGFKHCPLEIGDLQVISLGEFQNCPAGLPKKLTLVWFDCSSFRKGIGIVDSRKAPFLAFEIASYCLVKNETLVSSH